MNAENLFVPMWLQAYLKSGYYIDLISRYSLRKNAHLHKMESLIQSDDWKRFRNQTTKSALPIRAFDYIKLASQISAITRKEHYDAVHAHSLEIRGIISGLANVDKLIISPYGSDVFGNQRWGKFAPDSFVMSLIKKVLQKADLVLPTSKYMENYLINRFNVEPSCIFTQSWGIDLNLWDKKGIGTSGILDKIEIAPDSIVFLSYRVAKPHYRIHIMPLIQARLEKLGLKTHFIYCMVKSPKDAYVQEVNGLITKLNLTKKSTQFCYPLRPDELKDLLSISNFFFSIPEWDQISSTLLEGMYSGVVPIAVPLPAYIDVLTNECTAIVSPPVPNTIANQIFDMVRKGTHIDDDALRRNMLIVSRDHNRKENLVNIMQKISEVLQRD